MHIRAILALGLLLSVAYLGRRQDEGKASKKGFERSKGLENPPIRPNVHESQRKESGSESSDKGNANNSSNIFEYPKVYGLKHKGFIDAQSNMEKSKAYQMLITSSSMKKDTNMNKKEEVYEDKTEHKIEREGFRDSLAEQEEEEENLRRETEKEEKINQDKECQSVRQCFLTVNKEGKRVFRCRYLKICV